MHSEQIKMWAHELGFTLCGITPAEPSPRLDAYLNWVKAGMHGSMGYMAREDRVMRRQDLTVILPDARSLIVVGMDYFSGRLPDAVRRDKSRGLISNYAWGVDYHDVLLERLEVLAGRIEAEAGAVGWKAYVDTGAILERSHAEQAGLGFTGKNTMLIHPRRGSFFFLGEIITDLPLTYDEPTFSEGPGCGTCKRCLEACPTEAFPTPYTLDARRCISYLTIEHKGIIPRALRGKMGNWIYGCDICQEVCPWQRFAEPTPIAGFEAAAVEHAAPKLHDILTMTEEDFATRFAGSPIKRIKRERLVRNACVAAGNSCDRRLLDALRPLLRDESALVRVHAVWAVGQLAHPRETIQWLLPLLRTERDDDVITEVSVTLYGA